MLDKTLSFGAGFDWITPIWTFIQDYRRRPAVHYDIPADCGWHIHAIRDMLQESGIRLWGLALYQDTFVFSVRQAQARYTQYLLERSGIPYQGGIEVDDVVTHERESGNKQEAGLDGWLEQINGFVDSI